MVAKPLCPLYKNIIKPLDRARYPELRYAIACCIAYWLDSMGYGLDFKNELKSLLVSYPQVDPAAMGFPENWISEPLWR